VAAVCAAINLEADVLHGAAAPDTNVFHAPEKEMAIFNIGMWAL
jgi:hypothetical protein